MNSENSNIEDQLLARFIQGDVSSDERVQVEQWLSSDSGNQDYLKQLREAWKNAEGIRVFDQIDEDKNWNEVQKKLGLSEQPKGKQITMLPQILRYAAAVILIAAVVFLVPKLTNQSPEMMTLTATADGAYALPDGSGVWLNKGSQLTYPLSFDRDVRAVELKGEGFFEVEHNPSQPFVVKVGSTQTKVLGTSFNLKEADEAGPTELVLVTGKVEFSRGADQVILQPGDRVIVDEAGRLVKEVNQDLNFMAWKTRTLIFENTTMEQVAKDVAELYNVEINVEQSSFGACPLTTRFENEPLENVLETIKLLFGVEILQNGTEYTITGGGC